MGWTSYHASHYKNGTVDRKAECIAYFEEGLNRGHFKVEKSAMVGTIWYGAIRTLLKYVGDDDNGKTVYKEIPESEQEVWAAIFITSTNMKDYYNFSYKDMDEGMGPGYYDCPKSILDLLTPVPSQTESFNWREKCREKIAEGKNPNSLKNLPIGSMIFFENPHEHIVGVPKGTKVTLKKIKEWGKRSSIFWYGYGYKWKPCLIPSNYKVERRGE